MNYLDVALALPLLWGVYQGFTKGLIISVASLAALILGVFAAVYFSSFFGGYINNWFHPDLKHLPVFSFALTFVVVVIVVRLIGWGLDKMIKAVALGFANRLLGVFFNLLKWAFILSVLISMMDSTVTTKNLINEQSKQESVLYRPISLIAPFVFPFLKFERIKETIESQTKLPVVEKQI